MNYIDKLKKQLKSDTVDSKLIEEYECYQLIQSTVELLVKSDKKITIKAVSKTSGCDYLIVKKLLPQFIRVKTVRVQVRCTVYEKISWENKACKANISLSDLVSLAMLKSNVIRPKLNVLENNINRLVGESVKQNSKLNKLILWIDKNKNNSEQLQILLILQSIENHFRDMISIIRKNAKAAEIDPYIGLNVIHINDHMVE